MVLIKTNLPEVITRLRRVRESYGAVLLQVVAPGRWIGQLRSVATLTLNALADTEERAMVPAFVDTITAVMTGRNLNATMETPRGGQAATIRTAVGIAEKFAPPKRPRIGIDLLQQATVEEAREAIEEWVNDPDGKDKTREPGDMQAMSQQGQYANELVERMWWIFGIHPKSLGAAAVTSGMQEAIEGVMPHLVEYFNARNPSKVNPALVDLWLRRVLAAWSSFLEDELPAVIRAEFKGVMSGK